MTHVTVIGGGAVGVSCALFAQRAGFEVTVLDPAGIGAGASGSNAGIVGDDECVPIASRRLLKQVPRMLFDPMSPLSVRPSYLPRLRWWIREFVRSSAPSEVERISHALRALQLLARPTWKTLTSELSPESRLTESGLLYAYRTDKAFEADQPAISLRRRRGVHLDYLSPPELENLEPALGSACRHGLFSSTGAFTPDPRRLLTDLGSLFRERGGMYLQEEVVGFKARKDRIVAIETRTRKLPVEFVVLAAGAWSKPLAERLGARVPLDTERGYLAEIEDRATRPRMPIVAADRHVAITPNAAGVRLAGTVELAGLDARPKLKRTEPLVRAASEFLPGIATTVSRRWMSFRPSMPDSLPVIDRSPRYPSALLAFGHGHLGFTLAPVTGHLIAELLAENEPSIDLSPYSALRWRSRVA